MSDSLLLMDNSPPGSSVHGIFQARILEQVAISYSRGSSQPRDWTWVFCIADRHFTIWAILELTPKGKKKVLFFFIIGDWNAKVGSQDILRIIGMFDLRVNQIDYILCSWSWRSSIQLAKQDMELTVAQIMSSLLQNSDLNWRKQGKPLGHSSMT